MYKPQLEPEKRKNINTIGKKDLIPKENQVIGINGGTRKRKRIAIDTNTLMDDYLAMYGFKYEQNNVYLPLTVFT
jgi:hypothetical protein